jgi:Domain of unknown function (DUF4411)
MNEVYVLDTNVFIQAKRTFYPFEVCPGYWKAMSWHRKSGRVMSIDRVRDEIERVATIFGAGFRLRTVRTASLRLMSRASLAGLVKWLRGFKRSRIFFLKRGQSSPVRRSQMVGLRLMRNRVPRQ